VAPHGLLRLAAGGVLRQGRVALPHAHQQSHALEDEAGARDLDALEHVALRVEGTSEFQDFRVEGHHLCIKLGLLPPGRHVLTTIGTIHANVEACEGFRACEAPLFVNLAKVATLVILE
jgi:hypothetical protein